MSRQLDRQRQFNQQTGDNWDRAAPHRAECTGHLVRLAQTTSTSATSGAQGDVRPTLCLLGVGRGNDVDLHRLLAVYATITLVDFDAESVALGIQHQGLEGDARVTVLSLDVTGASEVFDSLSRDATPDHLEQALAALSAGSGRVAEQIGQRFDVVVSLCLVSQLTLAVVEAVGDTHPGYVALLQTVRLEHFRLLLTLTNAGGVALLLTDVVSSDTVPQLSRTPREGLLPLLAALVSSRNFFSGLNPFLLHQLWTADGTLAPQVAVVEPLAPWTWLLGERTYLVCGFVVTRRAANDSQPVSVGTSP
jgi:hypothetical protein